MAQNFDQAKHDNTFWTTPNILGGSVSFVECGEYKKITEKLFKNFCSKVQIIKPFTSKKRWLEKTSKSVQFFAKSLYISLTGRYFHGEENDILAGFGPLVNRGRL